MNKENKYITNERAHA